MHVEPVRVATWNCRQGIDRKRGALDRLAADVVVLQECGAAAGLATELGVSFLWRGEYPAKGLAVAAFTGWSVEPLDAPVDLPWVLPARITAPDGTTAFDLLAVWTVARKGGRPGYAGQIARLADVWEQSLLAGGTIVAGDFNCSSQGPSRGAHHGNLARLEGLGLRSAYHDFNSLAHGAEVAMTLNWVAPGRVARGYHCDFVFLPPDALHRTISVTVGETSDWIGEKLSDHRPVVVELGRGGS